MTTKILVTGATGTIGSQVVAALKGHNDVAVRVGVRSAAKAAGLAGGNVTPVDFEYDKPEQVKKAVEGVDKLLLVTPFAQNQVELATGLINAAKAAGVRHIVKLSALGADIEPGIQLARWHRAVEKAIEGSGMAWTFLRPNNFMENFLNYYPPDASGNIYLPWGEGACSWVAGSDVAAVAAAALTGSGHEGQAYEPTGPEALNIAQVAAVLSEVSGRKITYVDVPEAAASKAMLDMGMPEWMVNGMMELHAINKAGYAAKVTGDVQRIAGRAPINFAQFAQKNAARWKL